MKRCLSIGAAAMALALSGCGGAEPQADAQPQPEASAANSAAEAPAISDADLRGYKTSCEISAVGNGATSEQAKGLCECTVTALAEGKTPAEFDAMGEGEINGALEQCIRETGIGA